MIFKYLIATFVIITYLFSFSSIAKARTCKLSPDKTLQIACTYNCNKWVKKALIKRAKKSKFKLKITNIFNKSIDITKFDGYILPGGADINPSYYINEVIEPELQTIIRKRDYLVKYTSEGKKRDPFEYNFLKDYFTSESMNKTPILGICRGMQMLTVSQGIPLITDIKAEFGIRNRIWALDKIKVRKSHSLIKDIVGRRSFRGVELHHQGLRLDYFNRYKDLWPHLSVTGVSNKGRIAEVLEFSNRPVLGVQFHPEYTFGKIRRSIFDWLLDSACINRNLKEKGIK